MFLRFLRKHYLVNDRAKLYKHRFLCARVWLLARFVAIVHIQIGTTTHSPDYIYRLHINQHTHKLHFSWMYSRWSLCHAKYTKQYTIHANLKPALQTRVVGKFSPTNLVGVIKFAAEKLFHRLRLPGAQRDISYSFYWTSLGWRRKLYRSVTIQRAQICSRDVHVDCASIPVYIDYIYIYI